MWQDRAACKDADSALFLTGVTSRVMKAKEICESCPVIDDCLMFAIENEDFEPHVYGGMTGAERRSFARRLEMA
jgi:WhiB family transcriptional regulator, redox-sensing transcriptional regulator